MRILRSPDGCPWDREQTLDSLKPFVLEEAHEVVDAIERGDLDELRGEIGDLVFEGVFLAQLCAGRRLLLDDRRAARRPREAGAAPSARVRAGRRHRARDHAAGGQGQVGRDQGRRARREGPVARQPLRRHPEDAAGAARAPTRSAPGRRRSASTGPTRTRSLEKIEEELGELRETLPARDRARVEEEIGDLLFAVANLARKLGLEPEAALRAANRKFTRRFGAMQARLAQDDLALKDATLDQMEAAWQAVKIDEAERGAPGPAEAGHAAIAVVASVTSGGPASSRHRGP